MDQQQLGRRIQERRKAQGFTQEQLGSLLGVSAQAVSKWENGESAPDIGLLPSLCQALGTSADALLGIEGGPGDPVRHAHKTRQGGGVAWTGRPLTAFAPS